MHKLEEFQEKFLLLVLFLIIAFIIGLKAGIAYTIRTQEIYIEDDKILSIIDEQIYEYE